MAYFQAALHFAPDDLKLKWLLNLAHMRAGDYPNGVPEEHLIGLSTFAAAGGAPRFRSVAAELGIDGPGLAGGAILEDLDGDGQIVIGAEQWPPCLNPVTCANSLWSLWTGALPFLPAIWDTTADQDYEITNLVTAEPTVELHD